MTVHAEDLPLAVRRKLGLDAKPTGRAKPSRAGVGLSEPCPGHCGCGESFPTALAWERHAKRAEHTRWSIDLPGATK